MEDGFWKKKYKSRSSICLGFKSGQKIIAAVKSISGKYWLYIKIIYIVKIMVEWYVYYYFFIGENLFNLIILCHYYNYNNIFFIIVIIITINIITIFIVIITINY